MKRLLAFCVVCTAATPGFAADLILPEIVGSAYEVAAPVDDWTAFYAGVFAGYTGGRSEYWGPLAARHFHILAKRLAD